MSDAFQSISKRMKIFRDCYEVGLQQDPSIRGKANVELTIEEEKVTKSSVTGETGNLPQSVLGCMQRAAKQFTFPGVFRENIVFPVVFTPSSGEVAKEEKGEVKPEENPRESFSTILAERYLRQNGGGLRLCVDREAQDQINFVIKPDGSVEKMLVSSGYFSKKEVACLEEKAKKYKFPSFDGEESTDYAYYVYFHKRDYVQEANALILEGNYDPAIQLLNQVIKKSKNKDTKAKAYLSLGVLYGRQGKMDEAAKAYEQYIKLNPTAREKPYIEQMLKERAKAKK